MTTDWDSRFVELAFLFGSWSKDPERKVGAVIVSKDRRSIASGYNGFPRGIEDRPDRLSEGSSKLILTLHAELNAILNATFPLKGTSLYVTRPPCHECAKAIIQVGIARVVRPAYANDTASKWYPSWEMADRLLQEAGVDRRFIQVEEISRWER